jgi:apolipoprotein N-acyltransferase
LINVDDTALATFICYEIAYPTEILDSVPDGKLIVVISDDSWFGKSIAAAQHLQIAQMRALETGRPLVMGTNDGLTAVVDSFGNIQAIAPRYQSTVLSYEVASMQGSTPWVYAGIYPWGLLLLILLALAYYGSCKSTNKKQTT